MHELSIVRYIAKIARGELRSRGSGKLNAIGLRVGALAGVVTDSLEFCFGAVTKDTDLDGCSLVVEHLPVLAKCTDCRHTFEVERFFFVCPECSSGAIEVTQGYELEIAYLEVDEASPTQQLPTRGVHHVNEDSAGEEGPFRE
jgi:hydrogenase nickel incorporation protein HypA/HybF